MSFVLQHYPFTKPQLLEIHTSLLPPSNDSLKMNAQKTDPPRSCLSLTNRENICYGTCWFTNTKGLRSTCHYPPPPFIFFTAINLDIFGQVLCVSKHICPHAVQTFAVSLVFRPCCPPGVGSIPCWMTLTWWSDAFSLASSTERRRDISSARYSPDNIH